MKSHHTNTSTELSWTCAVIAAVSGAGAICLLACASRSPIDPISIFAALLFFVGTILGGGLGTLLGVIGAIRGAERARDRVLPAVINIVVVAGFWLTIVLVRPGPSFRGGPGGF